METTDFAKYLTRFFTEYLAGECGVSPHTIRSYSNTSANLLVFMDEQANIKADFLTLDHFNRNMILRFLDCCKPASTALMQQGTNELQHCIHSFDICNMRT